jgi:SAM-dependent methyltransferase
MLTPAKRRGEELLDDPTADSGLALRSLRDVALANLFFGGRLVVLRAFQPIFDEWSRTPQTSPRTVLDLGTGLADIPAAVVRAGQRRGIAVQSLGLERTASLARAANEQCHTALVGDAMQLPFADASVDVVMCSQVLHHFDGEPAHQLLRECTRVARHAVIVADLRRSWLAVGGLWSGSFVLGFHPVSRHDGMLSVLRGYTARELATLVHHATGCTPLVRRSLGFRLSATWRPPHSPRPA